MRALSVFSESTANGLKYYGKIYPAFLETSRYVKFISNIWNILSVKFPSKARRKMNPMFRPFQETGNEHTGMQYLRDAIAIFHNWQESSNSGLTSQTSMACIQTMGAVLALSEYLQSKHGFQYLLTGKLLSDPIEARYGVYRQSNGGNCFMSVKQLLSAEKKFTVSAYFSIEVCMKLARSHHQIPLLVQQL